MERWLGERERLAALRDTGLLDTPPEPAFDRITRLVAVVARAPIALVSLIDSRRESFKSSLGLPFPWVELREVPLAYSLGKTCLASGRPLRVVDARQHPLLADNPALDALGFVAYLGVPLTTTSGARIGVLAAIDTRPHEWSDDDLTHLLDLGSLTEAKIALRSIESQHLRGRSGNRPDRTSTCDEPAGGRLLSGRVLLVDDRPEDRRALLDILVRAGLTVEVATSGREALETGLAGLFDLIVIDRHLPEIDGLGVSAWLRRSGYRGAILAITEADTPAERSTCLRAGCSEQVVRTVAPERLLAAIADCLDRHLGETLPDDGRLPSIGPRVDVALGASSRPTASLPASFDLSPRDDPAMADLVREFARGMRQRVSDLRTAFAATDRRRLETLAHQTKGVAAVYGYPEFGLVAAELERALKTGRESNAVGDLVENFARVVQASLPPAE